MIDAAGWLFLLLQIFFVDLLLGADNAIVIALACRRLPPEDTRRAVLLGAIGAIVLRLIMILFANALLDVPLVKLVGAWMLVVIALNVRGLRGDDDGGAAKSVGTMGDFLSAAAVIMLADAMMSLDNVVALAAIAGGNLWLLALGVLFSIPIIAYGALILTKLVPRAPEIITVGAMFLGWIAGGMAVSDPLVARWVRADAPALEVFAPALVALFVLFSGPGTILKQARPAGGAKASAARLRTRPPSPQRRSIAISQTELQSTPQDCALPSPTVPQPAAHVEDRPPGFAIDGAASRASGWTEERVVVAGFVLLAFLAGLIIFIASFFDSLT
jgi:YjbE family integral membrane protein